MRMPFLQRLRRDKRASTIIEFAFVAPTLMVLLMGSFDLGYRAYVESVLQTTVQKAGRDSALEGGTGATAAIDATVKLRVKSLVDNGVFEFTRKNTSSFTNSGAMEPFTDLNNNGTCDPGEPYSDENNNSVRDSSGADGQGGARDITVYTAKVSYPRIFPMYGLLGWSPNISAAATTVLRNQPYGQQAARATRNCT